MKLVFLHSSDTHGFLLPTEYQDKDNYNAPFSLSRVSAAIKAEKEKYGADNVVVTDSGDCLQGSPLASYAHTVKDFSALKKFTDAYNEVGYDARCLGNHDFNFGLDYLTYYMIIIKQILLTIIYLMRKLTYLLLAVNIKLLKRMG